MGTPPPVASLLRLGGLKPGLGEVISPWGVRAFFVRGFFWTNPRVTNTALPTSYGSVRMVWILGPRCIQSQLTELQCGFWWTASSSETEGSIFFQNWLAASAAVPQISQLQPFRDYLKVFGDTAAVQEVILLAIFCLETHPEPTEQWQLGSGVQ